jgi:hypothetical protein
VPNNYETDLIFPIVQKAAQLAGIDYHTSDQLTQTALKVGSGSTGWSDGPWGAGLRGWCDRWFA